MIQNSQDYTETCLEKTKQTKTKQGHQPQQGRLSTPTGLSFPKYIRIYMQFIFQFRSQKTRFVTTSRRTIQLKETEGEDRKLLGNMQENKIGTRISEHSAVAPGHW